MDRIAELSEENFLQRSVYEMERERVEYLVRAYLRNRLQKVPSRNPPL
jgi:DNA-binding HxlR family transcriptional regulator